MGTMVLRDVTYGKPPQASACRNAVTYEENPVCVGVEQPRGQASHGACIIEEEAGRTAG